MSRPPLRTLTVAFSDIVDSVGLAEKLSEHAVYEEVLRPFYEIAERVITEHGGAMRPVFAGDKVLGVFGVPVEQVDDAVRAVEAVVALRSQVAELSGRLQRDRGVPLEIHIGVNTGTALVRDPEADPTAAFGDALNVGARLQDAAGPGEILLGPTTYELVRELVLAEQTSLLLRGKGAPLTGWRLLRIDRGGVHRASKVSAPLAGRHLELALLRWAYERMLQEGTCHLVNVLGPTGVGKTRLVEEFLQSLDGRPRVLRGHCPPYGPGITYRPIMQLVQQAAEIRPGEPSDRIHAQVMRLVGGDQRITARVMRLFGARGALGDPDDTFRAVQRVFELLAKQAPLVLVVEDLHAAQPASLEAIERLITSLQGSEVLVLCLARSEFLDGYRNWGSSIPNAVSVKLSPLSESQARQVVRHLLTGGEPPTEAQGRVVAWSGGNPFYLIELVAMLTDEGALQLVDGQWQIAGDLSDVRVTPKIDAVLGARLSRLEETERTLVQRASVVGMQFRSADVAALMSNELDHDAVAQALDELVRKELFIRDPTALATTDSDDDGFSFRHLLIQDTAYRRIDKLTRSELHQRYAQWLEGTEQVSSASLNQIGFHLDKAHRDRVDELGRDDDDARILANRAGEFLAEAGHQYVRQGDFPASAITSLRRAVELLPPEGGRQLQARLDLADALRDHGSPEAHDCFRAVEVAARDAGDPKVEMHALLGRLELEWFQEFPAGWEDGRQAVERAILQLVRLGDNLGLAKAYRLLAHGYTSIGESIKAREAAEQAIEFVRRAGDERLEAKILRLYCVILFWGPTPLDEVVRRNQEALNWARPRGLYTLEAGALGILARAAAMRGDFAQARKLAGEARSVIRDVGELLTVAYDSISEGLIELLADEPDAAIAALQRGYEALDRRGGRSPLAVVAANLARAFVIKEQYDDAERLVEVCREVATESQLDTQIKWRALKAVVLARRGIFDEAERLANEAVALAEQSKQPDSQAEALADLADVLQRAGDAEAAAGYAERALQRYELKGNLVAASRIRRWLAQLPAGR